MFAFEKFQVFKMIYKNKNKKREAKFPRMVFVI